MTDWTRIDSVRERLVADDTALGRAVVAIYKYQTAAEKAQQITKELNGVGFNAYDAEILSSIAEWYMREGYLSVKQAAVCRRRMLKYAAQLVQIIKGRQ